MIGLAQSIREDIAAVFERDPAARSYLEVLLCYPGLHALWFHRINHWLWSHSLRLAARWLSQWARLFTGIEIHPAAQIGHRLFVDHGMGVVIGETSTIGDDVTLYQGVVLGGISLDEGKRHPTLGNNVVCGSGAKILGPVTIGDGARIGSNAVVLKDVPAGATMVGVPARQVVRATKKERSEFCAYGQDPDLPDPVARAIDAMCGDIATMRARIAELEDLVARQREAAGLPAVD